MKQDALMKKVMDKPNIEEIWESQAIEDEILGLIG